MTAAGIVDKRGEVSAVGAEGAEGVGALRATILLGVVIIMMCLLLLLLEDSLLLKYAAVSLLREDIIVVKCVRALEAYRGYTAITLVHIHAAIVIIKRRVT